MFSISLMLRSPFSARTSCINCLPSSKVSASVSSGVTGAGLSTGVEGTGVGGTGVGGTGLEKAQTGPGVGGL